MARVDRVLDEAGVDGRLEERLQRLERLVEALLDRPLKVEVIVPEARTMGGCEREATLRLLVKLRRDLSRDLKQWPGARERAIERVLVYQAELEELLAEEPTYIK